MEQAAVYSALLNDELSKPFGYLLGDPILIVDRTYNHQFYDRVGDDQLSRDAPSLDTDTLQDFHAVNTDSHKIDSPLSANKEYVYLRLAAESDRAQLENYPEAISITTFSSIGFNQNLDQALVYMAFYCGQECGTANIYFLTRKGDIWKIKNVINVWAS